MIFKGIKDDEPHGRRGENVTLSGKERGLVKQAAAQYMENLKNAGDSFEITRDVAESLYEDYWKAEKLVETLTENVNLEVSDSEAKGHHGR